MAELKASSKVTHRFAATLVDELARQGLAAVCICPGSRSAPLAIAFARHPAIQVYIHIDERSASFFALGLAKLTDRPVAVLTTSGTATAELHPAVVEADLSRTPLLVLTADRPPELREVGANQVIDQGHIYGGAVRWYFDPGPPEDSEAAARRWRRLAARAIAEARGQPMGPVHLNLPLREPLTPEPGLQGVAEAAGSALRVEAARAEPAPAEVELLAAAITGAKRPLIVAGEMRDGARLAGPLQALADSRRVPILAEPTSHLRVKGLSSLVESYDALLREPEWSEAHRPDLVVRLGAAPTSRALSQLLTASAARQIVIDEAGYLDPELGADVFLRGDASRLLRQAAERIGVPWGDGAWLQQWRDAGAIAASAVGRALDRSPLHEGHVVRALAQSLPPRSTLMVGSSMAVRDLDTFWPPQPEGFRLIANRGASGIDGLVSTGLGALAGSGGRGALLLGDLSLYHDMNGLWAIRRHGLIPLVVVLDNNGGGIFEFLPPALHPDVFEEVFATPLNLDLADVARLYGLEYRQLDDAGQLPDVMKAALAAKAPTLLAARFGRRQSVDGHHACWAAVSEALL